MHFELPFDPPQQNGAWGPEWVIGSSGKAHVFEYKPPPRQGSDISQTPPFQSTP